MGVTDRVKARAKHPTGGAVTGRLAAHDPRNNSRINSAADRLGHGKGVKGTSIEDAKSHNSAPLSTLKDPSAFGPPPKHVKYHGEGSASATSSPVGTTAPPLPTTSKPTSSSSPAPQPSSKPAPVAPSKPAPPAQSTGGWGAPIPKESIKTKEEEERLAEEKAANAPPPVPYRVNTTGLSTDGLPKPPVRRIDPEDVAEARPAAPARAKPQPPPRLPARQNSNPDEFTPSPPPAYSAVPAEEPVQHQPAAPTSMSQLSELQSRFNRLPGRVSSPPARPTESQTATSESTPDQAAGQGTTWAQKQAALRTASQFNKDPSSVSMSDARAAAGTAQNFQQRHGEQVASGWQKAKTLDSKYGVRGKVGGLVQGQSQTQEAVAQEALTDGGSATAPHAGGNTVAAAASKKAPPPPPPKRRGLQQVPPSDSENGEAPPPVPLSSRPTF